MTPDLLSYLFGFAAGNISAGATVWIMWRMHK